MVQNPSFMQRVTPLLSKKVQYEKWTPVTLVLTILLPLAVLAYFGVLVYRMYAAPLASITNVKSSIGEVVKVNLRCRSEMCGIYSFFSQKSSMSLDCFKKLNSTCRTFHFGQVWNGELCYSPDPFDGLSVYFSNKTTTPQSQDAMSISGMNWSYSWKFGASIVFGQRSQSGPGEEKELPLYSGSFLVSRTSVIKEEKNHNSTTEQLFPLHANSPLPKELLGEDTNCFQEFRKATNNTNTPNLQYDTIRLSPMPFYTEQYSFQKYDWLELLATVGGAYSLIVGSLVVIQNLTFSCCFSTCKRVTANSNAL